MTASSFEGNPETVGEELRVAFEEPVVVVDC